MEVNNNPVPGVDRTLEYDIDDIPKAIKDNAQVVVNIGYDGNGSDGLPFPKPTSFVWHDGAEGILTFSITFPGNIIREIDLLDKPITPNPVEKLTYPRHQKY